MAKKKTEEQEAQAAVEETAADETPKKSANEAERSIG